MNVLLTLGRLPKALDLARSFANAGCHVLVAEPHRRHLVGSSRAVARRFVVPPPSEGREAYLRALAAIVAQEDVGLVVPVSEETMHVAFLRDLVPPGVRILTMPPEQVLELHDKARFAELAATRGLAVPETHALGSAAGAALAAHGKVVVKARFTCSGRGLHFVEQGAPLPAADPSEPSIVQAFIPGEEQSSCTLALEGRAVGTVVYRATLKSGSVAVGFERLPAPTAVEAWIDRFLEGTGWSGFISFDFILDAAGQPYAIECNPRLTSGVHFFETADIARAILQPGHPLRHRPELRLQQFWSVLTELGASFGDRRRYFGTLHHLLRTPDVTWRWRDPLPLLAMPWTAWPIIREANRRGVPFGEVATLDIGWTAAMDAAFRRGCAPAAPKSP